jgi:hypothetical protein
MKLMMASALLFLTAFTFASGNIGQKTANAAEQKNGTETAISEDEIYSRIFALPEVKKLAGTKSAMIDSRPSAAEPYYTVRVGYNNRDTYETVYWFHVYVKPKFEIKYYNVILDKVQTLEEWRNENK